jgi:hypothetical protein
VTIDDSYVIEYDPNSFYQELLWINGLATSYERKVYNLLDLLGDLGGVLEFILILFSIFLSPISEFSYYLKLAKKLFFARIKSSDTLQQRKALDRRDETEDLESNPIISSRLRKELMIHRKIQIGTFDKVLLFFSQLLGPLSPFVFVCWSKHRKLLHLYKEAQEKVDAQLNVVKIIKNLGSLKILLKNSLMTPEIER